VPGFKVESSARADNDTYTASGQADRDSQEAERDESQGEQAEPPESEGSGSKIDAVA